MAERIFKGIGVSHNIAIGPACLVDVRLPVVVKRSLDNEAAVVREQDRLQNAIKQGVTDISMLLAGLPAAGADDTLADARLLLEAHLQMLGGSRLLRGALGRIARDKINAEAALEGEIAALQSQFSALSDHYIAARMDDVRSVGERLLRLLMNCPVTALCDVPAGGIVMAHNLSPADTAGLDPARIGGVVTVIGGAAGHTAVVARGLGLPAVLGVASDMFAQVSAGQTVIVDGIEGCVVVDPSVKTLAAYQLKQTVLQEEKSKLTGLVAQPAITKDSERLTLCANMDTPRELDAVLAAGCDGIGLFRTEFLFMGRASLPDEDEQYEAIVKIVRAMAGKPVTLRTLDIGGDKMAATLDRHLGDAANPALGLRAIRLSLKYPDLLRTQFRAILRAGAHGPVRLLLPMVTLAQEVQQARALLEECYADLKRAGIPCAAELPPLGTMIEIPAAALSADSLARVSDFFSLGTNDLVQYTVAIDRGNDQVAELYNPLHPAVLRLMQFATEAGQRAGIPVSICGEMAADPQYTALLIGLGIRELSVGPASVARIKARLRELSLKQAIAEADAILRQSDPAAIRAMVAAQSV